MRPYHRLDLEMCNVRRMNGVGIVLTILICSLLSAPVAAQATTIDVTKIIAKVQRRYDRMADFKGKFKQVYTDTLYDRKRTSYGYVYVKKPGKMRWNYASPERKVFISDGKQLWVWEPADRQVFRNPLDKKTLSTGLTFLLGSGKLSKEFAVDLADPKQDALGGPDAIVLKLTPKVTTAQYRYLVLAIRPSDHTVTESMVIGTHSRNHFLFSDLVFDSKLSNKRFKFSPPPGTRVVDAAKLKRTDK